MATLTTNPYATGDPAWLKVWKDYNPDDTTGDLAVGKDGLASLAETDTATTRTAGGVPGAPDDVTGWIGDVNWAPGMEPGNVVTSPGRPSVRGPAWGPSMNWTPTTKATSDIATPTIAGGPTFFRPNLPGGRAPIFVLPQLPDPNDSNKTHYYTGAPIYWDPSGITGGTMGDSGMFKYTGSTKAGDLTAAAAAASDSNDPIYDVHGFGKALRVSDRPITSLMDSGYVLPKGYKEAIQAGGAAAAVDFLQSGPRGSDGLTAGQRALVSQIKAPRNGPARGANQFQELLDAYGASQTPTGTSVSPNKVTMPGGNPWRGGAAGGLTGIRGKPAGGGQTTTWADYMKRRNKGR